MTSSAQFASWPAVGVRLDAPDISTLRMFPLALTRHSLRRALGVIWLLDGVLQLQSFMFTKGFATQIIAPSASRQPFFVAGPVEWNARMIGTHPVLFNGVFASIQLALGISFLFRRTARLAIVSSVIWAGGVWYLGEGLGGLAGGHMTALLGAPGAALLYIVLAMAAWPSAGRSTYGHTPPLRRQRPPQWIVGVWVLLWVVSAVLNILPSNISSRTISSQLRVNASMVPSWLAAIDRGLASAVHAWGGGAVVVTVVVELAIGLLVLSHGPLRIVALSTGIVLAGLYWAVGQSFGQLFSGQATDPSTGPLIIILALAVAGTRPHPAQSNVQADDSVDAMRNAALAA
jgi:hypothetical protein